MALASEGLGRIIEVKSGRAIEGDALAAEARRRAAMLQRRGVGRGDPVLILHGGSIDFFCDLFAVWQAGGLAACANPGLTAPEIDNLAAFLSPKAMLTGPGFDKQLASPAPRVDLTVEVDTGELAPAGSHLDDPALILFTSGTTGAPKGVAHSHRSLLARLALNRAFIGDEDLARSLCLLPTHFGHGLIGNCLTPLMAGQTLYLQSEGGLAVAAELAATLDKHRITFMSSVPSFWKIALKAGRPPQASSLRRIHIGSAPLGLDLWRAVAQWAGTSRVFNMYGITETANWAGGAALDDDGAEDGAIGKLWGGRAAILDAQGHRRAAGEGEILLQTPALMLGYHKRADLTSAVLRDGWFHTGDIGRLEPDGRMRLLGRQKEEINRAGMKINPAEIDLLLERHPDVAEACCFALEDAVSGEIVAAAVKPAAGTQLEGAALRRWCLERARRDLVPERWFVLAEIPKTDRGKVVRANVRALCLEGKR